MPFRELSWFCGVGAVFRDADDDDDDGERRRLRLVDGAADALVADVYDDDDCDWCCWEECSRLSFCWFAGAMGSAVVSLPRFDSCFELKRPAASLTSDTDWGGRDLEAVMGL